MKNQSLLLAICIFILAGCHKNDRNAPITATDFTVPADSVKVNPYGYTPLSAQISFTSEKEGSTVIIVKGKHGAFSDVVHHFNDNGTYHSIPVIGMYAGAANTVLLRIVNSNGDTLEKSTLTITTGNLPADMPVSIIAQDFDTTAVEPGLTLVSNLSTFGIAGRPCLPYFADDYGDIRWVLDYSSNAQLAAMFYDDGIARLRNGNFYFGDTKTNTIYEVDLLGKILNTWSMPGYSFQHNVQEKPDGNFLITVSKDGSVNTDSITTIEDYIIEINRQSGAITTEWDLKQSLDEHRNVLTDNASDWLHTNAVMYDSTDNTIIVSGRTQGLIKLDYSNNVNWILAPHTGWGKNRRGEDLNQFLLKPLNVAGQPITDTAVINGTAITPDFEWNWYQHSNIFLPDGNIMLFDNGSDRTFDVTGAVEIGNSAPGKYSRAVEYKIDAVNKTVQQIWSYGKERDQSCYSSIISSVQYLPRKNHILFAPGFNVLNTSGRGGKIVEVDYATKQVIAETSISAVNTFGFHRAKKISAYPDNL